MILEGKLLRLGAVDKNRCMFSKDCKIDIPDTVPVIYDFDNHIPLGTATIEKVDDVLKVTDYISNTPNSQLIEEYIEEHGSIGVGGYYNSAKMHYEGNIKVIDSCKLRLVSLTLTPISDEYVVKATKSIPDEE